MEIKLQIPNYEPNDGIKLNWETGFEIKIEIKNGGVLLTANKEGLYSLANHLLNLLKRNTLYTSYAL